MCEWQKTDPSLTRALPEWMNIPKHDNKYNRFNKFVGRNYSS